MSNHQRPHFPPRGLLPPPSFYSRFQLQPRYFGIIGSRPNQPVNQAGGFPGLPAQRPWLQPGQQPPFPVGFPPQRPPGDYHPSPAGSPIDMNFWAQRAAQFNHFQQQQMAYQQASSYFLQNGYYPYNQYQQQPQFTSPGEENEAEQQSTVVIEDVSSPSPPPGVRLYGRNGDGEEPDGQQADGEAGGVEGILVDLGDGSDGQGSSGTESHVDRFLFEDGYQSQAESVQSPMSKSSNEEERQQPATVQQQMPKRSPGQDKKEASSKSPAPENKQESGKKKSGGGAVPKRRPSVIPITSPPCVHSLPVTPTGGRSVHFPDFSAISLPASPTAEKDNKLPSIFHKEPSSSTWVSPQQRNNRRSRAQMNKLARNPYGYIRGFHGEDPNAVDLNDFSPAGAVEKPNKSRNRAAQYKQMMTNKGSKAVSKNIKKQQPAAIVSTPIKGNNKNNNYGRFVQRSMQQAGKVAPATGKEAAIQMETPPPTPVTPEEAWPELTSVNVPKREADGNKWRRELMLTEETATTPAAPETAKNEQKVDREQVKDEVIAEDGGNVGEEPAAEPALITAEASRLAENNIPAQQEEADNAAAQASTPEPQVPSSAAAGDDHDFFVTPPPNLDDALFCLPPRFLGICSNLDPNDVFRLSGINEAYEDIRRQFYLLGAAAIDRTAFTQPEGESWTPEKPKPVVGNTGSEGGATAADTLIETLEKMTQVYRVPANDGSPSWISVGQALANEGKPTPRMDFSKYSLNTLFYQFYVLCATPVQLLAAHELHCRGWRFHKRWQLWIISSDETPVSPPATYVYLPRNNPFMTIRDILYFDQRIWDFVFMKDCRVNFMELELERPAIEHLTYMHHPFPLFTDEQEAGAAGSSE